MSSHRYCTPVHRSLKLWCLPDVFAVTDAELVEKICADAVQSARLGDEAEVKAMTRQCVEQPNHQLEEDSAVQDKLGGSPNEVGDREQ